MKNLTKKRGLFAAAAALLVVTTMLVTTWCSNDIGGKTDEFTPPAGKGAILLNFNKDISRTITPGTGSISDIDDFDEFQFTFTPVAPTPGTAWSERVLAANLKAPIILDPGTYELTIIGYIDYDPTGSHDIQAEATNPEPVPVEIKAGKIAHETVVLKLIIDGTDNGTFAYTLDKTHILPSDITSATMTLTRITGGGTVAPVDIKDEFDDLEHTITTVATGIYYVEFVLTVGGDTVTFTHVVHIYKGKKSSYTFSIGLNYFNAIYQFGNNEITFDDTDKSPEIQYSTDNGNTFTDVSGVISVTRGTVIIFKIKNTTGYTANSFEWYCLSNSPLTTTSNATTTCTINTTPDTYPTVNPYASARDYNLTVVGVVSGIKYATVVSFKVTP